MEGKVTCGLWVVVFLLGCGRLSAFNLDEDNILRKDGDKGSLFGFSLAMHWQLAPVDKRMLLVGAPRAKKLNGHKSQVPGGLYTCDMTSSSTSCTRVVFDDNEDLRKESKENQWMGVSVKSQGPGGKIVTCAHRYQVRANVGETLESRDIIGRCYVLGQSLGIDSRTGDEGGRWHFCENRNRGHEMFGSCQQGMSATFDKDYHYLIFGAPGAYNWKGVVRLEQNNYTLLDIGIYDDGPFEAGDEKEKNPTLYNVPDNSYLGFSLDSGMGLTKKDQLTVVAGAPRAYFSGAVVLMKKDAGNGLVDEHTLKGEGLASSFGYDLTVLDLNKDGWLDIVVGAPQYFEKDKTIGGAVYVYVNKAGKWNKVTPIKIEGPQDSMFGQAVENLGDINQDGFHDFAVGAPYANDEAGAVYIYHGSDKDLSFKKESQVLSGKPLGARMFGYSLAGNMDLDMNSYPDLAVGSLSDSVFVFKARPVITITKEINFSPKEIDLTKKNCGNDVCLDVEACFIYTANPKNYSPSLTVEYSLEADADHVNKGLTPRATFTDSSDPENPHQSKGNIIMATKGKKECIKRQLKIQENIQDKLNGINVEVAVNILGGKRKRRQSSSQTLPVLDPNELVPDRSELHFLKEGCGSDNICQSNLQVKHRYVHTTPDKGTFTPLELVGGEPVIRFNDQKDIALEVEVSNHNGDDAYEASVTTSFPNFLTYSTFHAAPELQITCTANKDGSQPKCKLGNPFRSGSEATFYIILGTLGFPLNTTELEIDIQLNTTSEQEIAPVKAKAKVVITLQLSVSGQAQPSQVYFTGKVKGESAMKKESDVGSAITHQFRIINLGKPLKDFVTASLEIQWPKETEKNKWLLYLMNITSTGVDHMECSPKDEVNHLKLEPGNSRKRRAAEKTKGSEEGTLSRLLDRKSRILSCDDGAKCVTITCPLRGLDSNAVITLNSRLWESTLIEDYSKLHHVEVKVKASLHIDSTSKNTLLKSDETEVRLTAFPERVEAQYGGVPWWIIVLSVLFGLLLLALLAFLLWKCFFEKKNEDQTEKEKLTANA